MADHPSRLLKLADVIRETSLSESSIRRRMSDGLFPKHHRIGPRRVAWLASDVDAWKRDHTLA